LGELCFKVSLGEKKIGKTPSQANTCREFLYMGSIGRKIIAEDGLGQKKEDLSKK
jgi:hypothetical protein